MKGNLVDAIVNLYRKAAVDLPKDVELAINRAKKNEKENSIAFKILDTILRNVKLARERGVPMCQDTGIPIFYVYYPSKYLSKYSQKKLKKIILKATKRATKEIPLRPNAVNPLTGKNTGNNVGINFPVIKFNEWSKNFLRFDLMLKGGGSENVSKIYKLPNPELKAGRDLEGIKKCVIDAVQKAQGRGCPPGIVGVGIGGSQDVVIEIAKKQLYRKIGEKNKNRKLAKLEIELTKKLNKLGIGPMGLGGKSTVLDVKIGISHRHPASFFVAIGYMCWACRRYSLEYRNGEVVYG